MSGAALILLTLLGVDKRTASPGEMARQGYDTRA